MGMSYCILTLDDVYMDFYQIYVYFFTKVLSIKQKKLSMKMLYICNYGNIWKKKAATKILRG